MIARSADSGTSVSARLGFGRRVLLGPAARRTLNEVEAGLELVDSSLATQLRFTDSIADATGRYLYQAGGKRVRPMLALLAAQFGQGNHPDVITAATALEITHLGSLYHDDVMDEADRRRGVPAAHTVWGNSVAILTGDLLFSRASQLMASLGERAIRLQSDTFERLVLGQLHETVGPGVEDDPIEFYIQVLADKTGSLISAAAQVGIIFSQAPPELEEPVRAYGEKIGVAFQLMDDVIDLSANPEDTGKVPGTDLLAGVPTMPQLLLSQHTDADSVALCAEIDRGVEACELGADLSTLAGPLARLREHEVTAQTSALADKWTEDAIAALAPLPSGPVREALERFAESLAHRSS